MNDRKMTDTLHHHLFAEKDNTAYAVLDGAAIPNLLGMIEENEPRHACLCRGLEENPELIKTSPYFVQLECGAPFTEWVLAESPGKRWGIFAVIPEQIPFVNVRKHFRDWLRVSLRGEQVLYRYYDPFVFNMFTPPCNQKQLQDFFGPVNRYILDKTEDEGTAGLVEYSLVKGTLREQLIP